MICPAAPGDDAGMGERIDGLRHSGRSEVNARRCCHVLDLVDDDGEHWVEMAPIFDFAAQ